MGKVIAPKKISFRHLGETFKLLPPSPEHAKDIVEAVTESSESLKKFMPWAWQNSTYTWADQFERLVDCQTAYLKGSEYTFHLYKDDEFVGCFGLQRRTVGQSGLEVVYWVRNKYTGRGIATATSRILVTVAFDYFNCERVQCGYNAANSASQKVIEKVGFHKEGELAFFEGLDSKMVNNGASPHFVLTSITREYFEKMAWLNEFRGMLHIETYV